MKPVAFAASLTLALLAGISAAHAASAYANNSATIYQGPGTETPSLGVMRPGSTFDATCNPQGWCQIYGTGSSNSISGWVQSNVVTFTDAGIPAPQPQPQPPTNNPRPPAPGPNLGGGGNGGGPGWSFDFNFGNPVPPPRPQPQPPRPQPVPVYEEAEACFYTERNFGGAGFCLTEGQEYPRLPRDWNDRIRSVEVFGGAVVNLCSDADFYGSCVTVDRNTSRLPSGIDRRVTSIEVYY